MLFTCFGGICSCYVSPFISWSFALNSSLILCSSQLQRLVLDKGCPSEAVRHGIQSNLLNRIQFQNLLHKSLQILSLCIQCAAGVGPQSLWYWKYSFVPFLGKRRTWGKRGYESEYLGLSKKSISSKHNLWSNHISSKICLAKQITLVVSNRFMFRGCMASYHLLISINRCTWMHKVYWLTEVYLLMS